MKKKVNIKEVIQNEKNPRYIREPKFNKLVKSIQSFPEMLEKRPIVVDENMIVLGGNMRLQACQKAGLKEVWIDVAEGWTQEQKNEFIIKDNVGFGEWDWEIIANEWNTVQLVEWALDMPLAGSDDAEFFGIEEESDKEAYTKKIEVPKYIPTGEKPKIDELLNKEKANNFILKIKESSVAKDEKDFLLMAAYRHTKFNYKNIAEYYAHANKEMQELMEDSALVIIDFNKALENGYVTLSEEISNQYKLEHNG